MPDAKIQGTAVEHWINTPIIPRPDLSEIRAPNAFSTAYHPAYPPGALQLDLFELFSKPNY